jgi:DNA-binding MarR family transcriptional regulator
MKTKVSLSRELADLSLVLMEIIKQEFKAKAGAGCPTITQFKMLHVIKGGVSQVGKLSEAFGISQPATSIMVDTMVKDGLLKKSVHRRDKRQIELHLTAKARSRFNSIYKGAFVKIDHRLSDLADEKKISLARQLHEISTLLSKSDA